MIEIEEGNVTFSLFLSFFFFFLSLSLSLANTTQYTFTNTSYTPQNPVTPPAIPNRFLPTRLHHFHILILNRYTSNNSHKPPTQPHHIPTAPHSSLPLGTKTNTSSTTSITLSGTGATFVVIEMQINVC